MNVGNAGYGRKHTGAETGRHCLKAASIRGCRPPRVLSSCRATLSSSGPRWKRARRRSCFYIERIH